MPGGSEIEASIAVASGGVGTGDQPFEAGAKLSHLWPIDAQPVNPRIARTSRSFMRRLTTGVKLHRPVAVPEADVSPISSEAVEQRSGVDLND